MVRRARGLPGTSSHESPATGTPAARYAPSHASPLLVPCAPMRHLSICGLVAATVLSATGCGYSEDQWQAQLAKYNQLKSDDDATNSKLHDAQTKVDDLTRQLKDLGIQVPSTKADLAERQKPLEEYQS